MTTGIHTSYDLDPCASTERALAIHAVLPGRTSFNSKDVRVRSWASTAEHQWP
jgi:hypothetical protein